MKRPFAEQRPIGPFNQFLPSDDNFDLEFILDEDTIIQKSKVQSQGRVNLDQTQLESANINEGDLIKARIFPAEFDDSVLEAAESGQLEQLFGKQPQLLIGAKLQSDGRINLREGNIELLDVKPGKESVVVIAEKI